jgi:alanine racemase
LGSPIRARSAGNSGHLTYPPAALLQGKTIAEALPEAGAVRPGLMLYGARPSVQQGPDRRLRPVMSVRARVVAVRDVAAGEAVGYGAGYRARAATRVATLPLGYADGVPCALFGCGEVWLAGARRPIVGRVSMDYVTVDIGDAPVRVGDEATFFGVAGSTEATLGQEGVPVEESASAADTHAYELLVRVGDRVPRTYLDEA